MSNEGDLIGIDSEVDGNSCSSADSGSGSTSGSTSLKDLDWKFTNGSFNKILSVIGLYQYFVPLLRVPSCKFKIGELSGIPYCFALCIAAFFIYDSSGASNNSFTSTFFVALRGGVIPCNLSSRRSSSGVFCVIK